MVILSNFKKSFILYFFSQRDSEALTSRGSPHFELYQPTLSSSVPSEVVPLCPPHLPSLEEVADITLCETFAVSSRKYICTHTHTCAHPHTHTHTTEIWVLSQEKLSTLAQRSSSPRPTRAPRQNQTDEEEEKERYLYTLVTLI